VHAPGINYLFVILLPAVFSDGAMQGTSKVYAKLIFWIENFLEIFKMFVYHLFLVVINYLGMTVKIIFATKGSLKGLFLVIVWQIAGPMYLLGSVFVDIGNFCRILCDSQEDGNDRLVR
jgi:hypothetical protein